MEYLLAQVNIGRLLEPLDSPRLAGFVAALDQVNAAADAAPGFVWRLQTEDGNATSVQAFRWDQAGSAGVLVPTTTYLRYSQPAYGTIDASFGLAKDNWYMELYGTNLNDSHASTFTNSAQFIKAEVPLRPMVVGLKVSAKF